MLTDGYSVRKFVRLAAAGAISGFIAFVFLEPFVD